MTRRCKLTVDNNLQPHMTVGGNYWAAEACVHNVQQFVKPRENGTCRRTYMENPKNAIPDSSCFLAWAGLLPAQIGQSGSLRNAIAGRPPQCQPCRSWPGG